MFAKITISLFLVLSVVLSPIAVHAQDCVVNCNGLVSTPRTSGDGDTSLQERGRDYGGPVIQLPTTGGVVEDHSSYQSPEPTEEAVSPNVIFIAFMSVVVLLVSVAILINGGRRRDR